MIVNCLRVLALSKSAIVFVRFFISSRPSCILFFILVRWSLPRFRYDQLMKLGWVFFFEIALVNVILTAVILMWVK